MGSLLQILETHGPRKGSSSKKGHKFTGPASVKGRLSDLRTQFIFKDESKEFGLYHALWVVIRDLGREYLENHPDGPRIGSEDAATWAGKIACQNREAGLKGRSDQERLEKKTIVREKLLLESCDVIQEHAEASKVILTDLRNDLRADGSPESLIAKIDSLALFEQGKEGVRKIQQKLRDKGEEEVADALETRILRYSKIREAAKALREREKKHTNKDVVRDLIACQLGARADAVLIASRGAQEIARDFRNSLATIHEKILSGEQQGELLQFIRDQWLFVAPQAGDVTGVGAKVGNSSDKELSDLLNSQIETTIEDTPTDMQQLEKIMAKRIENPPRVGQKRNWEERQSSSENESGGEASKDNVE